MIFQKAGSIADSGGKGEFGMEQFAEELIKSLNVEPVFSFDLFGHSFVIYESVVVSWIIMAVMILLSVIATRNLKTRNVGKRQVIVETIYKFLHGLVSGIIGEHGRRYIPYLMTVLIYIGISNVIGVFGFKPPTKDLSVTIALALTSIVMVQYSAIRGKGVGGWLKGFTQPVALVTPFNILDLFTRPLSLCMRLFGNVLGAYVIMELLKMTTHAIVPAVFSLYFDFFDGLIQAYIFVFLTGLYMKEAME